MPKFRKKPVVVEARQFKVGTWEEQERLADWCGGKLRGMMLEPKYRIIQIQTLEGEMEAGVGDWIIRGVKGEHYPCKNDIFETSYEKVED